MKRILYTLLLTLATHQGTLHASGADDPLRTMLLMDRFELHNDDEKSKVWEGSLYVGYDLNKLYLYSEGTTTTDGLESSSNELIYSRAIAPFWDIQAGIAHDKTRDASQTWGEVAVAGLAPYFFETRVALLVNGEGNIGLRLDAEYEALLTQRLILTPSLEADFYTKDDPQMGTGSGLSSLEAGLRLRYEIRREFAPYVGVTWEKNFGTTDRYNPLDETALLVGVRFWF